MPATLCHPGSGNSLRVRSMNFGHWPARAQHFLAVGLCKQHRAFDAEAFLQAIPPAYSCRTSPTAKILVVVVAVVCRAQRSGGCKEDNARATGGAATSWGACCTRIEPESSFSPAGRESRPVMSMKHPCFVRRSRFVLYHGRGVMKRLILDRAPFDGAKAGTATLTCAKDCQDHRPVCRTRLQRIPIPQRLKFQFG